MSDELGTSQSQCAFTNCTTHKQEELDMYCKDCKLPICIDCVQQDHKDHKWDKLKRVAQQIRAVQMSSESSANICLHDLQKVQDLLNSFENENSKLFEQNTEKIQKKSRELINAVEKEADKKIEKLKTNLMTKNNPLREQKTKNATEIEQIREMLKVTKDHALSMSDRDLLDMNTNNEKVLAGVNTEPPRRDNFIDTTRYTEGDIDTEVLTAMMGTVGKIESQQIDTPERETEDPRMKRALTLISKFTHGTETILSVFPVDDDHAWVHNDASIENHFVDTTGRLIKKKSLQRNYCASFFVQDNGDQVFSFPSEKKIQNISVDGDLTTIADTTPLYPWGITKTKNGDILVTLTDRLWSHYCSDEKSNNLVQLMSFRGKVKKTYKHPRNSEDINLFTCPFRVVQNHNSDICVVDQISEDTGRVCVLRENGGSVSSTVNNIPISITISPTSAAMTSAVLS